MLLFIIILVAVVGLYFFPNLITPALFSSTPVPLYRYTKQSSGDHFYTTEVNVNLNGWILERKEGYVYPKEKSGTVPFYGLYNRGIDQHFYTTDKDLGNVSKEYELIGIVAYVYTEQQPETIPLYRYFNVETGGHLYTTDFSEFGFEKTGSLGISVENHHFIPKYDKNNNIYFIKGAIT